MTPLPGRTAALAATFCLLALLAGQAQAANVKDRPGRKHEVYFAGTPDELNVYRLFGARDGKTLMIIGGIQGDEPGGFLSADLYADVSLAKGNLIVVPRANIYSIILGKRGPDGDMNRQFGDPITARRHAKIIKVLKALMAESDLLLNLHDGSGFFRPHWEGPMANPSRYGQSLIADAGLYTRPDGQQIDLADMARTVLERVNPQIENPKFRLRFSNHRTAEADSIHKEQRLSATFYALTRCGIPAFGVESSKSLPSEKMKIRHHVLVINAFMDLMGIKLENPRSYLTKPKLDFLVISVNRKLPLVVRGKGTLTVSPGDRVKLLHIEANYERGLTADILGMGSLNDTRRSVAVDKSTEVVVRKDHQEIGRVAIRVQAGARPYTTVRSPIFYFVAEVRGQRRVVADGETLHLVRGDTIKLVDVLSNLPNQRGLTVNFKGFVPAGQGVNAGEDRGHEINTARDLMERYATCPDGTGAGVECYRVVAGRGGRVLGSMRVEVVPARLDYLVLQKGGYKLVYYSGETVRASAGERLRLVDLKSNVGSRQDLSVVLDGRGRRVTLSDGLIDLGRLPAKGGDSGQVRLLVLRDDKTIGHVRLKIER